MTLSLHSPTRRALLLAGGATLALPGPARAARYKEITWDDLIPPGVPYGQIIADGEMDVVNDTWKPVFDENSVKLNTDLDGAKIKMPGYIIPLEITADGVHDFILVPYVGACIHVPPPPPNQLVFVHTDKPWPGDDLWDAVWVSGTLSASLLATEIAEIGYSLAAERMTHYE